jgi:hypothetical protein
MKVRGSHQPDASTSFSATIGFAYPTGLRCRLCLHLPGVLLSRCEWVGKPHSQDPGGRSRQVSSGRYWWIRAKHRGFSLPRSRSWKTTTDTDEAGGALGMLSPARFAASLRSPSGLPTRGGDQARYSMQTNPGLSCGVNR